MQPTPADTAPEHTDDRGVPARAKFLAGVVFLGVLAAMIGAIELVSPSHGWRHLKFWGIPVAAIYWPLAFRVMRRIYGEHRVETDRRNGVKKQAKYRRWFWGYFMPIMALFFAIIGGIDVGPAWKAWHGQGQPGWAVAEHQECTKTCSWKGTFRSDDGTVVREDIWIRNPPADVRTGDRIRAVDARGRTTVFDATGDGARENWWLSMALFLAAGLYLAGWLAWITGIWHILLRDGDDLI